MSKTLFPLGELRKSEIREIADASGLINANKPDSQDICFVKDGDYVKFLEESLGIQGQEGNFIDSQGNILGRHKGIIHYTIGQRKGLGITFGKPMYVIAINSEDNTVTLGDHEELFKDHLIAGDVNFISQDSLDEPSDSENKIQSASSASYCYPMIRKILVGLEKATCNHPGSCCMYQDI